MGSVVIPKTLLRIQGFGAAVLGLIVLVTMTTAASPAADDANPGPGLFPRGVEITSAEEGIVLCRERFIKVASSPAGSELERLVL